MSYILLVEDNDGDIRLVKEALREYKIDNNVHVATTGEAALAFLREEGDYRGSPRPDLILLDLNLPGMHGKEVLTAIKADENLTDIPVVVLTSSEADQDVLSSYRLNVNCYITKPVDLDEFLKVVKAIEDFWFKIVVLPSQRTSAHQ